MSTCVEPTIESQLQQWRSLIDLELVSTASQIAPHSRTLQEAVTYVLEGQGKRLRALLVLALARDVDGSTDARHSGALAAALAVEMLHAASLVHDDLPALDNDDTRRGRPSCHRAFSEGTAILTGDLLVGRAMQLVGEVSAPAERVLRIAKTLSRAWSELCVGQQLDIEKPTDAATVQSLMELKTGALFGASAAAGVSCGGLSPEKSEAFFAWGVKVGVLCQRLDDISDGDGTSGDGFDATRECVTLLEQLKSLSMSKTLPHTEVIYRKIVNLVL